MRRYAPRRQMPAFAAGLLTLTLVTLAVYLAFIDVPFTGGTKLRAVFDTAQGVQTRSPVRIAGIEVGKVTAVESGPGESATVTMELDESAFPIHADATVKIRPRIFLEGNVFLDLQPGTPSAPALGEDDVIPLSQTATPVQLDQILTGLQSDTRSNLKKLVRGYREALEDGGAEAIAGGASAAGETFSSGAQVAEALRGGSDGVLSGLVDDGGRTAAAIARDQLALAELVTGFNRTARGLSARRGALAASIRELDAVLIEAEPALDELNALFPPARGFVRDIRPGLREAPRTLRLANPLLAQVQGLLSERELPALRRELRPALISLGSLAPRLVELLDLATPVTECVRRNALPTLLSPIEDPPHSTGVPVYQELLYGMTGLSSASQNFDGNGPAVRYHAGFGDQTVTVGRLPGTNEALVGLSDEPILGSRPKRPAERPPFRPDVPCITQERVNLAAETGP